jgi:3-phenylpropionate/trans-cinnamate dioxygenase ferredoxin subunit
MPETEYVNAGKLADYAEEGLIKAVEYDRGYIAVVQVGGKLHAFTNTCPHAGFPLSGGGASPTEIMCFAHGAVFNIETGAPVEGPAYEPIDVYEVRIEGEDVLIAVPK